MVGTIGCITCKEWWADFRWAYGDKGGGGVSYIWKKKNVKVHYQDRTWKSRLCDMTSLPHWFYILLNPLFCAFVVFIPLWHSDFQGIIPRRSFLLWNGGIWEFCIGKAWTMETRNCYFKLDLHPEHLRQPNKTCRTRMKSTYNDGRDSVFPAKSKTHKPIKR